MRTLAASALITALFASASGLAEAADIHVDLGNVRVQTPHATITFGSRNDRGYYWDGYAWRDPGYWKRHHGPRGQKYYTGHRKGGGFCPPGQAKKGNC